MEPDLKQIDQYISDVQKELEQALIDVYRLEGALAMLKKLKADFEKDQAPKEN